MTEDETNRRDLLCGLAAGATIGVTGCIDGVTGPSGSTGNGGFERVAVEETKLVVELQSTAGVETVNVIAPDGSLFAERPVSTGATRLEFELGFDYPPGEFDVVAVGEENSEWKTKIGIRPKLEISDLISGYNHPDQIPKGRDSGRKYEARISIKNRGNGPVAITKVLMLGDLPNPTVDLKNSEASGILDSSDGEGERERIKIPPGADISLVTNTLPFFFNGDGITCDKAPMTGEFWVKVQSSVGGQLKHNYQIRYSESKESDRCQIQIQSN